MTAAILGRDNVDDGNLTKIAGTPFIVTSPPPRRPAAVMAALLAMSKAEAERDAAQVEENKLRQALAGAIRRTTEASQEVARSRRTYDESLLLERKMRVDPVEARTA